MFRKIAPGFTLIELLVVIAIIALLAAILFPVFERAREKSFQTTCSSNQRQLAAAMLMSAQDNDELLPPIATVWTSINVESQILVCPTKGPTTPNAYLYSYDMGGTAMGTVADPTIAPLTIDGNSSTGPGKIPNIAYFSNQFEYRHTNNVIASFLDGHVSACTNGAVTIKGALYPFNASVTGSVMYDNWTDPLCLVVNSANPALGLPAADYSAARGGSYAVPDAARITSFPAGMITAVGKSGYALFNWNIATLASDGLLVSPRLNIPAAGPIAVSAWTVGGGDGLATTGHTRGSCRYIVGGVEENTGSYGNIGSRSSANSIIVITVKDPNVHFITLDSNNYQGNFCPRGLFVVTSPINNAQQGTINFTATSDPTSNTGNRIFQFVIQFSATDAPTGGTVLLQCGNNSCLKGIWFD